MTSSTDSETVADLLKTARKRDLIDTWYVRGSRVVVAKGTATYSTDIADAPRFLRAMLDKHDAARQAFEKSERPPKQTPAK